MFHKVLTVSVAAASIAAATAAPLADVQPSRAVSTAVTIPVAHRGIHELSAPKPNPKPHPRVKPKQKAKPKPRQQLGVRISSYRVCNRSPQACIDAGSLTLYGQPYGVNILAGHNYQGYQWLTRLPVGRRVTVTSGAVAGTYRVTGHMRLSRQSGNLPSFGGAALVLQSCEGAGTGFSLLERIS